MSTTDHDIVRVVIDLNRFARVFYAGCVYSLAMAGVIKSRYVVEAPHMSKPWLTDTRDVEGKTFVKLNKWDYGLVRYATDKALNFRKGPAVNINLDIMDKLCHARNVACDQLFAAITQAHHDDDSNPKPKRKKYYSRVAKPADLVLLPATLDLILPSVHTSNGGLISGHHTIALTEGLRTRDIFLELTIDNIEYVRKCALEAPARGRHRQGAGLACQAHLESSDGSAYEALPESSHEHAGGSSA